MVKTRSVSKVVGVLLVLVSTACQSRQNNPVPPPAPDGPSTTVELTTTTTEAIPEPPVTTVPAPTDPDLQAWGPVLCPYLPHPLHHSSCPTPDEDTKEIPRPTRVQPTTPPRPSSSSVLAAIRACESGNDYSINTGNGYYGAYQFALSTWESVGGSGYPHLASPAEQDYRAQLMLDQGRRGEWEC